MSDISCRICHANQHDRWGHRIPAYFIRIEGDEKADESDGSFWVVGRTAEEAQKKAEAKFPGKKFTLERDPDCLE
jgi:valyl-tRNA synthetase